MLTCRGKISISKQDEAKQAIADFANVLMDLVKKPVIISSYRALGSEIDPIKLEQQLRRQGADIALPVVTQKAAPLMFKIWQEGDLLRPQTWGILEPAQEAATVLPDVLLLPMLAFDRAGWRLGYGGGFYDRTLQILRARKPIFAVGLAYTEQEIHAVPHDSYDQPLDYALLPNGIRAFATLSDN